MGWKQGRIPEIVLRPLPLAEVFLWMPVVKRAVFLLSSFRYQQLLQPVSALPSLINRKK